MLLHASFDLDFLDVSVKCLCNVIFGIVFVFKMSVIEKLEFVIPHLNSKFLVVHTNTIPENKFQSSFGILGTNYRQFSI